MMLGENEDQNMVNDKSFYSKGVWQRISVLFAGPGFNFILAFVLSVVIIGMAGFDTPRVASVEENGPAAKAGLMEGDLITEINGTNINFGKEVESYFAYHGVSEEPVVLTVKRNGEKMKIKIVPEAYDKYMLGFSYSVTSTAPAEVLEVSVGYPMDLAGIKPGDIIVGVNDARVENSGQLMSLFKRFPLTEEQVKITYLRDGVENTIVATPKYSSSGYTLGFSPNLSFEKATAWETIRYSAAEVKYWIVETGRGLVKLFTGKIKSDEVGSAIAIVDVIGETYEASSEYGVREIVLNMLYITVILSANLGVMNLLPIPALDGGKLLFCAIEVVRGKPVDREKEGMIHFIGMIILLLLMVFLTFNDIKNVFFK